MPQAAKDKSSGKMHDEEGQKGDEDAEGIGVGESEPLGEPATCSVGKPERKEYKELRGRSVGQRIWGSLRTEDALLKSACSISESTGHRQENGVKRVVETKADHRNERRKWMKRKAAAASGNHPPGIFQEKTEK